MSRSELVRYNQDGLYSDDPEKNMSAVLLAKLKAKIGEKRNGTD
jgi:uridylate kinase